MSGFNFDPRPLSSCDERDAEMMPVELSSSSPDSRWDVAFAIRRPQMTQREISTSLRDLA